MFQIFQNFLNVSNFSKTCKKGVGTGVNTRQKNSFDRNSREEFQVFVFDQISKLILMDSMTLVEDLTYLGNISCTKTSTASIPEL